MLQIPPLFQIPNSIFIFLSTPTMRQNLFIKYFFNLFNLSSCQILNFSLLFKHPLNLFSQASVSAFEILCPQAFFSQLGTTFLWTLSQSMDHIFQSSCVLHKLRNEKQMTSILTEDYFLCFFFKPLLKHFKNKGKDVCQMITIGNI